jgi:hypothetical protein
MENKEKHRLSEWLDKIQQESWQLELLITGFSIFLMLGLLKALQDTQHKIDLAISGMGQEGNFVMVAWVVLAGASLFVLLNLIIHIILRGLWISAVGLRSVSGEIDFDQLKLAPRFEGFLRRKTGSFDTYIERLENLCSIVFAFTFLVVFIIISIGIWVLLFGLLSKLGTQYLSGGASRFFVASTSLVMVLSGLLYVFDFITLGWLKRRRWLSKIYYPIYRFYGIITLSGLYRPMYYNLIDNKLGRKAGLLLIPYILMVLWMVSLKLDSHIWFPDKPGATALSGAYYDDLREEKTLTGSASIPSKYVHNGFIELFIRYFPSNDDRVLNQKCPDIKPVKKPGIRSDLVFSINGINLNSSKSFTQQSLACMASIYEIHINDSIFPQPSFRFFEHPNAGEKGLFAVLDVQYLPRGAHQIRIRKLGRNTAENADSLVFREFVSFPFWKE